MSSPSVVGNRRLSFGVQAADRSPPAIADAKAGFAAQLKRGVGRDTSNLLTTRGATELFAARAQTLKNKDKAAFAKFPTAAQVMTLDVDARLARIATTDQPLIERLSLFWIDHFTAAVADAPFAYFLSSLENEAIRPHMLGNFTDLLLAVTTHPAMLLYLNNRSSIGPNSPRGARAGKGLNENHAREVLELHSLGVNGGYTQADIIELAKAMTGWTINIGPHEATTDQRLAFDPSFHEPGVRTVMGRRYPDTGKDQALAILRDVAARPATATFISHAMLAHFIGDSAPPALERKMAKIFTDSGGDLMKVTLAMVEDDATWSIPSAKVRPPIEFVGASARLLGALPPSPKMLPSLKAMGQPYLAPSAPNGWPKADNAWAAPDAVKSRLDWADQISAHVETPIDPHMLLDRAFGDSVSPETRAAVLGGATFAQSLTLLLLSPEFQRR